MEDISLLFGRLHPLLVHLPIGALLLLILFEFLTLNKKYAALRPSLTLIAFWSMVFAIFSCVAGYLLSLSGEYDNDKLSLHKWMGIGVAFVTTVFYTLKKLGYNSTRISVGFSLLLFFTLMVAGHYGGVLTHGEEFLNEPIMAVLGQKKEVEKTKRNEIAQISEAVVYRDLVEPIFEGKCIQCHNENKKKGGLRMDSPEFLLKGGKSGTVLIAGDIERSELFKRLHLPVEDKHRMPPKGKKQLTGNEISLVQWWIQSGASIDKTVAQLPKNEKITALLKSFDKGGDAAEENTASIEKPEFSAEKVTYVPAKDLERFKQIKLLIAPIDTGKPWLYVNAVNNPDLNNAQVAGLLPFKQQIVWLKIGNTRIDNDALHTIGQFTHLTRLNLEYTGVDDAGVVHLKGLPDLQMLNLVGTGITDKGLMLLAEIKSLKRIYLWQTKTSLPVVAALRQALPLCEINTGEENILSLYKPNK